MTPLFSGADKLKCERRFWPKVQDALSGECWRWLAYKNNWGYGVYAVNGIPNLAHRVAYWLLKGPIPEGLVIDHLCRVRDCVNPSHMEPVTLVENILRGDGWKVFGLKTHCPMGHPFSSQNTYRNPAKTLRGCKKCRTASATKYRARLRAEGRPVK